MRQLLNHSAGWMGDDYGDFGRGEDAIARYLASVKQLRQLTPPGEVFAYNNAAVVVAGRVIETLTGKPYETALQELVLEPLGLRHSGFFTDQLIGESIAASHDAKEDHAVVMSCAWAFPRSIGSTGGLISSAREQLAYARFHLGDVAAADGKRVVTPQSLQAMRSNPGPGGTIPMEIDGVCMGFWRRRTAEGVPVFQHGGSWGGQNSDFFFVPDRQFAMTVLTNSTGGPRLMAELGRSDSKSLEIKASALRSPYLVAAWVGFASLSLGRVLFPTGHMAMTLSLATVSDFDETSRDRAINRALELRERLGGTG